jgi:hypothetical protein
MFETMIVLFGQARAGLGELDASIRKVGSTSSHGSWPKLVCQRWSGMKAAFVY